MKQPGFDSVNAELSVADTVVEWLRSKNVLDASVLHFGLADALGVAGLKNVVEPTILQ